MEVSVARLPEHPNFDHLKKQAKDLLGAYHARDAEAFERFRVSLPAASGKPDMAIAAMDLKLHDAQSCVAREYGFPSWINLKNYVDLRNNVLLNKRASAIPVWLNVAYGHRYERPKPERAVEILEEHPELIQGDFLLSCAVGDDAVVRSAIAREPDIVHRTFDAWTCPCCNWVGLAMPPLVAVTHSSLLRLERFRNRLYRTARTLLDAGASPNQSARTSDGDSLSALYGAAGRNHNAPLTRILLDAGADPNDNESLYHSRDTRDLTIARMLLDAGAIVEGTNALLRQLDFDDLDGLRLMLAFTRDVDDASRGNEPPLLHAIRRRRSPEHVRALLDKGADPRGRTKDGTTAYRLALRFGLTEVAALLSASGAEEPLSLEDQFLAACARGDAVEARRFLEGQPGLLAGLSERQLQLLPQLAEARNGLAVRVMVGLGWPIAIAGGSWDASALNQAVFNGDAELTRFLLEHGASWTERHGYGDNVHGTLSFASRNHDAGAADWVGCAQALVDHGLPVEQLDGDYSDEVADILCRAREAKLVD
jgi:ankyrin repeat protein